jgi:hypothetical protein
MTPRPKAHGSTKVCSMIKGGSPTAIHTGNFMPSGIFFRSNFIVLNHSFQKMTDYCPQFSFCNSFTGRLLQRDKHDCCLVWDNPVFGHQGSRLTPNRKRFVNSNKENLLVFQSNLFRFGIRQSKGFAEKEGKGVLGALGRNLRPSA